MSDDKVYLSSIRVSDLRGVRSFEAKLGLISIIVGENGAGKTTLLSAIANVLEGGHDPDSIRNGATEAKIEVELSNGATAVKTVKPTESDLIVKNSEGGIVRAPATYLKAFASGLSFNPVAFLNSDPKERAAFLLKTLPLTFEAAEVNAALGVPIISGTVTLQRLNEMRDGRYEERKALNVQARDLEGTIAEMRKTLPDDDATNWGAERDRLAAEVASIDGFIKTAAAEIELEAERARSQKREEIDAKISALCAELAEYLSQVDRGAAASIAESTAALKDTHARLSLDLGEARAKADRQQQSVGVRRAIDERTEALKGYTLKEIRLTQTLKAIDELKHQKLRELPIEGLDLKADNRGRPVILIGGVPLDKLNRQQQLYVAIQAVSLAAGKMPMMLCEVAELDNAHLEEISQAAADAGIQLVLARWMDNSPLRVMSLEEYMRSADTWSQRLVASE